MLEKRNIEEKEAAGDAGALDDIVDMAAGKMGKAAKAVRAAAKTPVSWRAGADKRDDA